VQVAIPVDKIMAGFMRGIGLTAPDMPFPDKPVITLQESEEFAV